MDPGVAPVYAGFGGLMLTTVISYLSHSQVIKFNLLWLLNTISSTPILIHAILFQWIVLAFPSQSMFCFDVGVNGINVCLIYIGSREAYVDEN
jgi:hypothetical protein